jgi:hypothetical protein
MIGRKNIAGESGSFNPFGAAVAALAVCAVAAGVLFAPMGPTSRVSAATADAVVVEGPGYFPVQYVNRAVEIELQPETF